MNIIVSSDKLYSEAETKELVDYLRESLRSR